MRGRFDQRKYLKGPGIVYSPYGAKNQCKTAEVMAKEVDKLKGFSTIRIYGGDCNQLSIILKAAKGIGAKLMIGVWDIGKIGDELTEIIKVVKDDWEHVDTLAIGNELIDQLIVKKASPAEKSAKADAVVAAIKTARERLGKAGWKNVPVVTVDTWIAIRDYPILCQNSDYIAANAHPYFDGNVDAAGSGKFFEVTVAPVLAQIGPCKGKFIRITGQ